MSSKRKPEGLLTRCELAEHMSVSDDTIDKWRKYHGLPWLKLPGRCVRFDPVDVQTWRDEYKAS